jgi:hypothetical protein
MLVYLDTEFNGFGGDLISLALVPRELDAEPFYAVRAIPRDIDPWVKDHVLPVLKAQPMGEERFKAAVQAYLLSLEDHPLEIIADWPEDIAHLCAQLCDVGGRQLMIFPFFELVNTRGGGGCVSSVPHNALEDAIALRQWHIGV